MEPKIEPFEIPIEIGLRGVSYLEITELAVRALLAMRAVVTGGDDYLLPQADITRSLTGKTIEGHYGNGRSFTERYLDDGRIEYSEGGPTIGGHWSVTAGTLCTIYDTDPTGGCFSVAREGDNCFEFYFAARTEQWAPGPKGSKPSWTARGSIRGEAGTCHDGANV